MWGVYKQLYRRERVSNSQLRLELAAVRSQYQAEREEVRRLTTELIDALKPKAAKPNPEWVPGEDDQLTPEIDAAIAEMSEGNPQLRTKLERMASVRRSQKWAEEEIVNEIIKGAPVDPDLVLSMS